MKTNKKKNNSEPTREESIRIYAEIIVDAMFERGIIDEIMKEGLPIETNSDLPIQDKRT